MIISFLKFFTGKKTVTNETDKSGRSEALYLRTLTTLPLVYALIWHLPFRLAWPTGSLIGRLQTRLPTTISTLSSTSPSRVSSGRSVKLLPPLSPFFSCFFPLDIQPSRKPRSSAPPSRQIPPWFSCVPSRYFLLSACVPECRARRRVTKASPVQPNNLAGKSIADRINESTCSNLSLTSR